MVIKYPIVSGVKFKDVVGFIQDTVKHGTKVYGERCGRTKLKESDIYKIFEERKNGKSYNEIAEMFGIKNRQARRIIVGESWKHIKINKS